MQISYITGEAGAIDREPIHAFYMTGFNMAPHELRQTFERLCGCDGRNTESVLCGQYFYLCSELGT